MATPSVQHILELAKSLSPADRAAVARDLLATLDYPGEELSSDSADSRWRSEARLRAGEVLRAETKAVESEEVHARIAQRFQKPR